MLRKYSDSRTLGDNIKLGTLTSFAAGMVNVTSLLIFFAFSSNVTGHYAILASEVARGNYFQIVVVSSWIFLFFLGGFISNLIVIHFKHINNYVVHATPLVLEIICLLAVGFYGQHYYQETLTETELLMCLMLFAMGLQNGLTASISNFLVKTTHLTGATTEIGILCSMLTKKEFRNNKKITDRIKLQLSIAGAYLTGAIISAFIYFRIDFQIFYIVCLFLTFVVCYDLHKIYRVNKRKIVNSYIYTNTSLPKEANKRIEKRELVNQD